MRFCLILCLTLQGLSIFAQAQQTRYVRAAISNPDKHALEVLQDAGVDLHCGSRMVCEDSGETLEFECRAEIVEILRSQGIHTNVRIEDVRAYYAGRAEDNLPSAKLALSEARVARSAGASCSAPNYPVPDHFHLGEQGGFFYYDQILAILDSMATEFPGLVSKRHLLSDSLVTVQGRPVYWVKISNHPEMDEAEPEVLYTALTHAREPASAMSMLYYMWYLLEEYATDPAIKRLVDNTELYFIPVVNPDGYIYNEQTSPSGGGMWRKNMHDNNGNGQIDEEDGVDLNRNYGYLWGVDDKGSSPYPHQSTYRGEAPFSEPEIRMIREFVTGRDFKVAMHDHSYGDDLYHAWGHGEDFLPDVEAFNRTSDLMTWENRYLFGQLYDTYWLGAVNGGANDWFYGEQTEKPRIFSWVAEISPVFWPLPEEILPICQKQLEPHLMAARVAGRHARIDDLNTDDVDTGLNTLSFRIENLGLTPGNFSIELEPGTSAIQALSLRSTPEIALEEILEQRTVAIDIVIDPAAEPDADVIFDIVLKDPFGIVTTLHVQKKVKGRIVSIPTTKWFSEDRWGSVTQSDLPGETCLTDSPTGPQFDEINTIALTQGLDLRDCDEASVSFLAKWDIESTRDFVQMQVRTNGVTWIPVCGRYTKPGAPGSQLNLPSPYAMQPEGQPVYDGRQKDWVREVIDLSSWSGLQYVEVRFLAWSGSGASKVRKDGFYFTDFKLHKSLPVHCHDGVQNGGETGIDCGGADCGPCPTCADGILNGDEEEVDCGGTECEPCATCFDGIQNGDEEDVDCGGSVCNPCPTCFDGIQNGEEEGVDCGGVGCVPCIPTCFDGIQNGDEEGVDCGGVGCVPCRTKCCNESNNLYWGGEIEFVMVEPNPAGDWITIRSAQFDHHSGSYTYDIFDLNGKVWLSGVCARSGVTTCEIGDLPNQMYVVRLSSVNGIAGFTRFIRS